MFRLFQKSGDFSSTNGLYVTCVSFFSTPCNSRECLINRSTTIILHIDERIMGGEKECTFFPPQTQTKPDQTIYSLY